MVIVKWSQNNNNEGSTAIDYIFSDGTDVFWNELSLSGGGSGTGTVAVANDFTIGGAGNAVVDAETNDNIVDIEGNLTIGSGDRFEAAGTSSFTIGGNMTSTGSFSHNNGQVSFDGSGTSVISGGDARFL